MNKRQRLLGLLALCSTAFAQTPKAAATLEDVQKALATGSAKVFDIRERTEFATGVAAGMSLIPVSELAKRLSELPAPGKEPFLIICNTQNRSSRVVAQLQSMGYTNAQYVHGGMAEWGKRGWPMVKP